MAIDAARLREARQRRAMTMRELAAEAEIGMQTIWRLENGATAEIRMTTLRKLAQALRVEPADLLETEHQSPETT